MMKKKISRGLTNVAKQFDIKLNLDKFYCKNDENISVSENQKCEIVAELFLSKGTTLYGKTSRLTPISSITSLGDSISISNKDKKILKNNLSNIEHSTVEQVLTNKSGEYNNVILSDDTISKIKIVMKEAFSEVMQEPTKHLSMLVEVIKELTVVIDNPKGDDQQSRKSTPYKDQQSLIKSTPSKDQQTFNIKSTPSKDKSSTTKNKKNISFNKNDVNVHFDEEDIPNDEEDITSNEEDLPFDEEDNTNDLNEHKTNK